MHYMEIINTSIINIFLSKIFALFLFIIPFLITFSILHTHTQKPNKEQGKIKIDKKKI